MRYFLPIILFFILYPKSLLLAQGQVYSAQQYTISDGLSSNSITVVFQDSKGFIWIGTDDGLNRYDGTTFEIYRHITTDDTSISGNYIISLAEDNDGNIWIGTRKRGLSVYFRETGNFKNYQNQPSNSESLPENDVFGFYISKDGNVWVKTESHLCRFNKEHGTFSSFGHYSNLFKRTISMGYPVYFETDTTLLVGTKDGLNRFFTNKGVFERLFVNGAGSGKCNEMVSQIVRVGKNLYLASTHSGLQLFEPDVNIVPIRARFSTGSGSAVNTVFADKKGNVWVGTKNGLESFRPDLLVHEIAAKEKFDMQSVVPYEITSIYEDASGLLWVGTRFMGVFKVSTVPPKFFSISENDFKEWPLRSFNIQSVNVSSDDRIWLGTLSSGVYSINRNNGQLRSYTIHSDHNLNVIDAIFSVFQNDNGELWLGTNSGIYILNINTGVVEEFNYGYDAKYVTLLRNNQILSIVKDKKGAIWFGTQFGLYRFNDGRIIGFFKEDERNLPSDEIYVILPNGDNQLWIGTGEGLCYFDQVTGLLKQVKLKKHVPELNQQILSLAAEGTNKLWVGTRTGLLVLERDSVGEFEVREIEGLKNDIISGILLDDAHRVWISSGKGISFLAPDGTVQTFTVHDGIPGHIFNQGSAFRSSSGELFFGGVSGLCWLHPDSVSYNLNRPRIAITGISVCYRGDCDNVFIEGKGELQIKYKPGTMIEVSFAALEFTHPQGNHYKIMLDGYDKDWRRVSKNNTVSFSNLMPGKYTLKIIASNNDLIWNNQPLEFTLLIKPPLWMTGYAYAFYLLVVVFIIQLVINYRIRHYRKANRSLTEKTQDKQRIEAQKSILSRINQNHTDSITYATRIQSAMIPTEKRLQDLLPKSFVYFRPRDMVSGDFYYLFANGKKTFIAVVDCTGHGVPGAFMSIIGMDLLKGIVEGKNEDNPGRILQMMNQQLEETFAINDHPLEEGESMLRDGMDMGLCVIDHENETMDFAGAVNDAYIIRDNEILTYKGSRTPLGRFSESFAPEYETIRIPIQKNDMVYLFTDGYADQFGGPDLKKFKYRRFRHVLLNIHKLAADDQKAILHQKLEEWRSEQEQVDDILVLGFSPSKLA